jgi:sugar phosphate isomerase/epimerase
MSEDRIGFGSYKMGVSGGLKNPPFIGIDQGINWGAPVVELYGEMGRVGKTGVEAIKNLAEANKVDVTWHIMPTENFELAAPDKKANQEAMRSIDVGINHAADSGIKLINIHPTQVLPREEEDRIYVYDKTDGNLQILRVPPDMEKEKYLEILNKQKESQVKEHIGWGERYADAFQVELAQLAPLKSSLEEGYDLRKKNPQLYLAAEKVLGRPISSFDEKELKETVDAKYENLQTLYTGHKTRYEVERELYNKAMKEGFVEDGRKVIEQNAIKNLADVAEKTMKKNITLSIENTDRRYMYSTPQELNSVISGVKEELRRRGYPNHEIEKYVGACFDMGHAATMQGIEVTDVNGEKVKVGSPSEFMKGIKHSLKEVHAHENFGDVDAHLPLGEAFPEEERKKMEEYLKKQAPDTKVISEAVVEGTEGLGFLYSMRGATDLYSVKGTPTDMLWGPTYVGSTFDEGLFLPGDKREHYFYSSFTGGLF